MSLPAPAASCAPAPACAPRWLASLEVLDSAAASPPEPAPGEPAPERPPPDWTDPARRYRPPAAPQRGFGARARVAVAPLPAGAAISDLLLVRAGDYGPTPTLAAVADSAAGSNVVRAGALFGLYWELYTPAPADGRRVVAVTATRVDRSAWERLGALVGRATVLRPVSLRYVDPVRAGAPPGRYVAIRWPVVPPGVYRLTVSAGSVRATTGDSTVPDSTAARAELTVRVVR